MGSTGVTTPKQHAVIVPWPAQGHINPLMHVAKILHSKGFHITFVNTEYNHKRYLRNQGDEYFKGLPDDFRFETIPDGLPPSDRDATQDIAVANYSLKHNCFEPFLELVNKLNASGDVPPVTAVVADGNMTFSLKVAKMKGIKDVGVWTASAIGMWGYMQFDKLVEKGIVPFKDESFMTDGTLYQELDWIPGMPNMRLRDLPTFMRITDLDAIMFNILKSEVGYTLAECCSVLINTYDEIEHDVLEVIKQQNANVYTVGPLPLLYEQMPLHDYFKKTTPSLWKEDTLCLDWLDKKDPDTVVYANYGSIATMTSETLLEFAWGLANCGYPFLWIVRPDILESNVIPPEYFEQIKDRGLLVNWCNQEKVLAHPAIGIFISHCGWNSTLEAITHAGKPFLCWPFCGEQPTNTRYVCTTWGFGKELSNEVKREEIVERVKELMEGEDGKVFRARASEWKKKAHEATNVGGSSYVNLKKFFKDIFDMEI